MRCSRKLVYEFRIAAAAVVVITIKYNVEPPHTFDKSTWTGAHREGPTCGLQKIMPFENWR